MKDLLAFTRSVVRLRREHPVFRRRRFLDGAAAADLLWLTPAGISMTAADWADPNARSIALLLDGDRDPDVAPDGTLLRDEDRLVLVNAWWEELSFTLPRAQASTTWQIVLDSHTPARSGATEATTAVGPRSLVVLQARRS